MEHDLEGLAENLQAHIDQEAKVRYGQAGFERWMRGACMGRMAGASCIGRLAGACGDTIEIYLKISGEHVVDASGFSDGCGASQVCAGLAAELALGATLDQAATVEADTILAKLPGFPEDESHCAKLAAEALYIAIHNYLIRRG